MSSPLPSCTNLIEHHNETPPVVVVPFLLGCLGPPHCSSDSWTESSICTLFIPLLKLMILSSIMIGSGKCSIWGLFWDRWGGWDSWQTQRSMQLGRWKYGIWVSTWTMCRCSHKLIRQQQFRPAWDPRPKRRWNIFRDWLAIIIGLYLIIRISPAHWLILIKSKCQIQSRIWMAPRPEFGSGGMWKRGRAWAQVCEWRVKPEKVTVKDGTSAANYTNVIILMYDTNVLCCSEWWWG